MEKEDDIVTLAKFNSPADAYLLQGYLEENGLIVGVLGDSLANAVLSGITEGSYRVVVFRRDFEQAHQLMENREE